MAGWRTAVRIARREALRAKGRSALVAALIALPVAAVSFVAVSYDSFRLSAEQELTRDLGAAAAEVSWVYDGPAAQNPEGNARRPDSPEVGRRDGPATAAELEPVLRQVLPPETRAVPRHREVRQVRTPGGRAGLQTEWLDLHDPVHDGRVVLVDGRAPEGPGEAALTRRAVERFGATVGDEVVTADGSHRWSVVGLVEYPYRFQVTMVLPARDTAAQDWLIDSPEPVTWQQARQLNEHGLVVQSRQVRHEPPPASEVDPEVTVRGDGDGEVLASGLLLGGMALLEVVLLAGPAFAVGARRRERQLALVAAGGGTPAHRRRIVLADGVVLGAAGAALGVTVGALTALGLMAFFEEALMGRRAGGLRLFPAALAGAAALAVFIGLVAALVPAATAARRPVVAGLSGRRGVVRSRRRWVVLGAVATGTGMALAAAGAWRVQTGLIVAGLVAGQLGLVLCTPALVGLVSRAGRVMPLAPRVALRDTARNRAAAAPAVSAVMAVVAGALTLGVYLTSNEQRNIDSYQAGLPVGNAVVQYETLSRDAGSESLPDERHLQVREAVAAALPDARTHELARPGCPAGSAAGRCRVAVTVPTERRCPAAVLREERLQQRESTAVAVRELLSAEEQRRAREDPRCREPRHAYRVHVGFQLVDDGTALPALTGAHGADLAAARDVLSRGGMVTADPRAVVDGTATLEVTYEQETEQEVEPEPSTREVTVPAYAISSGERVPFAVLSPAALADTGLAAEPFAVLADNPHVPTTAQRDALREELAAVHPDLQGAQVETGPSGDDDPFLLVLGGVAGVVALVAAAIATGLAAADRRGDLTTLGAVGASPRVRRLLAASQAGAVAGLGALLGTAAGLGSAYAVVAALNQAQAHVWPVPGPPYPMMVPWQALALLLVVVPGVAVLGAGLFTRSRLPVERRRPA